MSLSITAINPDADARKWYLYLIENRLGHLYIGITLDPTRRIAQHRGERPGGAKALRGKSPLLFRAVFAITGKAAAMRAEYRLKRLSSRQKWLLIEAQQLPDAAAVTAQFTGDSDSKNSVDDKCDPHTQGKP